MLFLVRRPPLHHKMHHQTVQPSLRGKRDGVANGAPTEEAIHRIKEEKCSKTRERSSKSEERQRRRKGGCPPAATYAVPAKKTEKLERAMATETAET
jgi:hypothetical protein